MDITNISTKFRVRKLANEDISQIYKLEIGNPLYFEFCPPFPSYKSIIEDMNALPPNKTFDDKFYIGFYDKEQLVAIMDLIFYYPNKCTAFIGLFMMGKEYQGKGLGSEIIDEMITFIRENGFDYVRLGYMKGNNQSRHFWEKNGFKSTGVETDNGQSGDSLRNAATTINPG